jgi:hypothetical protein
LQESAILFAMDYTATNRKEFLGNFYLKSKRSVNKWANEGIFLLSCLIPVYEICALADVWIFNTVEFWTGKNWIEAPSGSSATGKLDDHHTYTLTKISDKQIRAEVFEDGRLVTLRVIDQSNGVNSVLRDENGVALVSASEQLDGSIEVVAAR